MTLTKIFSNGRALAIPLALLLPQSARSETAFGGPAARDVSNWTTSSVVFDDAVQSGHSLNWENVLTNEVVVDTSGNKFDLTWEADVNYTIGHLFMYQESFDLASVAGGIQGLLWHADLEASAFSNWSPVISVTVGGETRYYRWNHSGNDWNGNEGLNFSNPMNATDDPNEFDLSQLGNASNGALGIWGELNAAAANFASTRDNPTGPDLQASEGLVRFGFLQWTSSGDAALESVSFSTAIDCFEVIVNPDPAVPPVLAEGGAKEITAVSAVVAGEMTEFGNAYSQVTLYWGTTDGGEDPLAWENVSPIGVRFCEFETNLAGLAVESTYHFRWYADNEAGGAWSDSSGDFTTLSSALITDPELVVTDGSSSAPGLATLTGEVVETGNETPEVTVFYGLSDGGTNPAAWDASVFLGPRDGLFSEELAGLTGGGTYFYRAFAENSGGAAWSANVASVQVLAFQGVSESLASEGFGLQYEMDVDPSSLDLDLSGSTNDWFPNPAMASGVDQTMWIPQVYEDGLAKSNQGAGTPEALFRSDFTGSVTRESLTGDFSVEVSLRLLEGTQDNPGTDLGGFSFFINPPGKPSLKLNINENTITTGFGENETAVGSNTDAFHQFRVSYVEADEKFWVWKDGTLILGGTTNPGGGISGSEASVYGGGGFLLGDYSSDISGDWEVDYIRLNDAAAAPLGGGLQIVDSGLVGPSTFYINFMGNPSTTYSVKRSSDLSGFEEEITRFLNGTSPTTDATGSGRVEFDISSSLPGRLFFRLEKP